MQLFYTPEIENGLAKLDEMEARHCQRVLRKGVGDFITVADGKGHFFEAEILALSRKKCELGIRKTISAYPKKELGRLHIAIAPTKNINRLEWFLEKTTEIGIETITPIWCARSERKVIKAERLEKILLSAMKQSLRPWLPELRPMVKFDHFIAEMQSIENQLNCIAYCNDETNQLLKLKYKKNQNVCILIGPEGDFSEKEVQLAKAADFEGISLGKARLRTETAGVVACTTINLIND